MRRENVRNLGVGKFAGQSIGAKKHDVMVYDEFFADIRLDFRLDTDTAHEHVAHLADTGLALGDLAAAYLFGDERMVLGKLLEVLAAKTVSAAIANVGHGHAFLGKAHRDNGGTHAVLTRIAVRGVINRPIGEPHAAGETIRGWTDAGKLLTDEIERGIRVGVAAMCGDRVDSETARDFAGGKAAHAVGENEQIHLGRGEEAVFVVVANAAGVGSRSKLDRERGLQSSSGSFRRGSSDARTVKHQLCEV